MVNKSKKNKAYKKEMENMLKEHLSLFAENFDIDSLNPKTSPSAIAVGGTREIDLTKLEPQVLEKYLWLHPVVPRGIEMKANRMVRRGYTISENGSGGKAEEAKKYCMNIIENSGGTIFLNRWIKDAYGFGNGFWTLVPNKSNDSIIRLNPEHPVFFRPSRYEDTTTYEHQGPFKVNRKTKEISTFTQVQQSETNDDVYVPIGEEIPSDMVAHLMFDRWGDEPLGISIVQYVFLAIKYCLNLEEAAAERLWRDGFTQKKVITEITNERDLKKLAKNMQRINSRDALILPKGTDVENLLPGTSDFPSFHKIYLKLLAIRLGIPMPLLTLDATSTNKSTIEIQKEDILADFSMDEEIVKHTIENKIFKPACELKFGKGFPYVPSFDFNELPEDENQKVDRFVKTSEAISNVSKAIKDLSESGISLDDTRILNLLDYLNDSVRDAKTLKPVSKIPIRENDNGQKDNTIEKPKRENKKEGNDEESS